MSDRLAAAVAGALDATVARTSPVGGGCICEAGRVELADGRTVFAKLADGLPGDLLPIEAEGLRWLGEVDGVPVPEVLAVSAEVLVLTWLPPGVAGPRTDEQLGRALARLHASGAPAFGWHRDGYIGREPQRNTPTAPDWPAFWVDRRIAPLVARGVARGTVDPGAQHLVDRLRAVLPDRAGPAEPPARVHGDLWSGNVHVDDLGRAWLVDPAPYGGHREVDLAMLHLFGRPGSGVIGAYDEAFPLAEGWRERLGLWQVEPLLNHAVMFGGHYGAAAVDHLRRWS